MVRPFSFFFFLNYLKKVSNKNEKGRAMNRTCIQVLFSQVKLTNIRFKFASEAPTDNSG